MSSTGRSWTVDGVVHALPHSQLRATFMHELSFTDVRELPAVLDRWVAFVEDFEADRDRIEQLRSIVRDNGHLPSAYTAGLIDVNAEELQAAADDTARRRGAA
ncbi:hypothetical protein [Streptomyces sp. NPDC020742]|uniref:hypothetical protein n=1 Tax=unclassified Streptomyces TaxID=2593676 RepID=UPI0034054B52